MLGDKAGLTGHFRKSGTFFQGNKETREVLRQNCCHKVGGTRLSKISTHAKAFRFPFNRTSISRHTVGVQRLLVKECIQY